MRGRFISRLAHVLLFLAWFFIIGAPVLATVLSARWGVVEGAGGGFVNPSVSDIEAGRVLRPLILARTSVLLVLLTEAIALPLGIILAGLLCRTDVWGRRGLLGLFALALFVPLPLHATAWLGALGNVGRSQAIGSGPILVRLPGAGFVHAMAALPWVVLLVGVGLRTVEPELEETALLDMPRIRVFWSVTLRRSIGALCGAALAVAVLTAGDMTVTDLLQVRTYAEEAYLQLQLGQGPRTVAAVALPPLLVLGTLVLIAARGLMRADPARLASAALRGRTWSLGRWRVPLGGLVVLVAGNLVAVPLYGLLWRAGRVGGKAALGQVPHWSSAGFVGTMHRAFLDVVQPLLTSLIWATTAASVTVVLAWALAWVSRRPGGWRWLVAGSLALLLAVPGPIAGMALGLAYHPGWVVGPGEVIHTSVILARLLGASTFWLIPMQAAEHCGVALAQGLSDFYDSPGMVVLALVVRTLPYALLVLWPAVRAIPPEHFDAAAVDGYGCVGQVLKVGIPLTRGAILASWGVSFALGLGELPASNRVSPPGVETLSLVIWSLLHTGVESHLAGVALVMLGVIGSAGLLAAWALGRLSKA